MNNTILAKKILFRKKDHNGPLSVNRKRELVSFKCDRERVREEISFQTFASCRRITWHNILIDWRITSSAENNYLGGRDEHVYGRETRKLLLLKRWKRMNLSYGDRKSINIPLDRNERIKFTVDWEFKIKIPCRGRKCVERVCFSAHVYKKNCELHLHEYNRNFW